MARTPQVPRFVRAGNLFTSTLLRAGVKLNGFGKYPMYLLTVRGRKTGQPRTISIVILEQGGRRYLSAPYGDVNWVRNLRAAGEAILTRGRHAESVTARELPPHEAGPILREEVRKGHPFAGTIGVTADSTSEEFERATITHPLFLLEPK